MLIHYVITAWFVNKGFTDPRHANIQYLSESSMSRSRCAYRQCKKLDVITKTKRKNIWLTQLPQQLMFQLICLVMDSSNLHSCLFQPWPQLGQEKTLQKRWTSCDVQCILVYCYFSIPSGSIHGNPILMYDKNQNISIS